MKEQDPQPSTTTSTRPITKTDSTVLSPGTVKHHLHDVSNCRETKDYNERGSRLHLEPW